MAYRGRNHDRPRRGMPAVSAGRRRASPSTVNYMPSPNARSSSLFTPPGEFVTPSSLPLRGRRFFPETPTRVDYTSTRQPPSPTPTQEYVFTGHEQATPSLGPAPSLKDDDHDVVNEIIMAVNMAENGTVGCAYYVVVDEALFLQEDVCLAGIAQVETLLLRIQPTTVLAPSRAPDRLIDFLRRCAQDLDGSSGK